MKQQYKHTNDKVYTIDTATEIDPSTLTSKTEAELLADGFTLVGDYVEPVIEEPTIESDTVIDATNVGNTTTGEDNLIEHTISRLYADGDYMEVQAFGVFGNTTNNKKVKAYFGSTVVYDSGAKPQEGGSWVIRATIIRISSTTQKCIVRFSSDTSLYTDESVYAECTEDLASSVIFKCTGTGTDTDDIVQHGLIIKYYNNGN